MPVRMTMRILGTSLLLAGSCLASTAAMADQPVWPGINALGNATCAAQINEWRLCQGNMPARLDPLNPATGPALELNSSGELSWGMMLYFHNADWDAKQEAPSNLFGNDTRDVWYDKSLRKSEFGLAVKARYHSFGVSLGMAADRSRLEAEDPMIFLDISNRW